MYLEQHKNDHAQCAALAAEMLGGPVRALVLDWELESVLERRVRLVARRGIAAGHAILRFQRGREGHELAIGAELYRLDAPGGELRIVRVIAPRWGSSTEAAYQFWAVAEQDYRRLYGILRRAIRRRQRHAPPLMPEDDQRRLWANTIGFLKQTQHQLRDFGVPAKRGVLLLGEPGNGKTMACRWLRSHCNRLGLLWNNVTAEEFETSRKDGNAHQLFELHRPGIVIFDDVDMAIRQRGSAAESPDTSTFLGGLDGLDLHHGVVYIFTTNATLTQLDPAFLRPGRIDLVLEFRRPSAELRRKLITQHWHADLINAIDVDHVVQQTADLSFAEMEEIERLTVLAYLEHGDWNWNRALSEFHRGRGEKSRAAIGFQATSANSSIPSIASARAISGAAS